MPFIAYLSQTLNKNNKQQQHTSLRLPRLSALRRPRTHQHPSQRPRRLQGVCILIKQDARVHYPTINSNQHPKVTWPASPHNPIQNPYRDPSSEGSTETTTQTLYQQSRVIPQGPTVCQDQPIPRSFRFHAPAEAGTVLRSNQSPTSRSSTIPLASSTITTQPNAV